MNWYLAVLKKYVVFNGRAGRSEFWYFVLFNIIISIILRVIDGILGTVSAGGTGVLSSLYSLAVLLPSLGVGARRLHDTDRSGLWLLIGLIPLIGAIVLIIFWAQESKPGANQYDSSPQAV
jgi:uncharacterized membrane protein YhaH (DUF805 family)